MHEQQNNKALYHCTSKQKAMVLVYNSQTMSIG